MCCTWPRFKRPMLLDTIDVTCCPGASQLPSNTGTLELVAQARVDDLVRAHRAVERQLPEGRRFVELLLTPRVRHQDVGALERRVVDLAPHVLHMAALQETRSEERRVG